jgi:hypothetical protein
MERIFDLPTSELMGKGALLANSENIPPEEIWENR